MRRFGIEASGELFLAARNSPSRRISGGVLVRLTRIREDPTRFRPKVLPFVFNRCPSKSIGSCNGGFIPRSNHER